MSHFLVTILAGSALLLACNTNSDANAVSPTATTDGLRAGEDTTLVELLGQYTTVRLESDLSELSDSTKRMIPLLIEAAKAMDEVFWIQAYGDKDSLLNSLTSEAARRYVQINYGPWDRLDGNAPFLPGFGEKPEGSNLYPADVTEEELLQTADLYPDEGLTSLYTLVRRGRDGRLQGVPYHVVFRRQHETAARYLRAAAAWAEDEGLRRYLELRADALETDEYQESDFAWMDMRTNPLDIVIGPIETYEDQLFGYKAAHEAFVLVKDMEWSARLQRFASMLPALQRGLPVPDEYKAETPGSDADLGAYDVVYVAGDANAGAKTIAINLPNDEEVQLEKGSRRLQLKNVIRAKFDRILVPIAEVLIVPEQRDHVTFDAFFSNTMFHEVAHGLGIKNTLAGEGTIREALRDHYSWLEEGKADVLGLFMIRELIDQGEWEADVMDHYVTFVASIFRSIRFGAASAHGRANLVRLNYFLEQDALEINAEGQWRINPENMGAAIDSLSRDILILQGDGDYEGTASFLETYGELTPQIQGSLDRVSEAQIPVDVVFEQGVDVLGLRPAPEMPPVMQSGRDGF